MKYTTEQLWRMKHHALEMYEALLKAKETIKIWHNTPDFVWAAYQVSPEMTIINEALARAEEK